MDDVALILVGAVAGGVVTGLLGLLDAWRQRQLHRRVGALLILGDMYVLQSALELVESRRQWPQRYDFMDPLTVWRETRESLASAVKPWQWMLVDGLFSDLRRTAPMARPGETTTDSDLEVVAELKKRLEDTMPIVVRQATSKRQVARAVKEVHARKAAAAQLDTSDATTSPGPPT